jgi:phenylpropionate dioxygenase-like ring-hydroxylating dioxygenase large terminal subunit
MRYDLSRAPAQVVPLKSYQAYLDEDSRTPPPHFREMGDEAPGDPDIAVRRYVDRAFYERERAMWDKVWQVACRVEHLAQPGDYVVYDIAQRSYIVSRAEDGEIYAFPNACLHRGRRLRTGSGHTRQFRCPFHGFTWGLDGGKQLIPCAYDFPELADGADLRRIKVDTFAGWVFINPDPDAPPLADYVAPLDRHYASYLWNQSYLSMHIGKVLSGNWKVVQEAFMESFHSLVTHPQILAGIDDLGCQYDVWAAYPHVSRMMVPFAAASPYVVEQVDEQSILDGQLENVRMAAIAGEMQLAPGQTARQALADRKRATMGADLGLSLDQVSDAELIDGWYYNLFPNLMLWGGLGPNMWYRFRPHEDSHERTLMEVGFIGRHAADQPRPAPAAYVELDHDTPWTSIPELGTLGHVLDQDTTNMAEVQRGLAATFEEHVHLARYQENRLRRFHHTLDHYLG